MRGNGSWIQTAMNLGTCVALLDWGHLRTFKSHPGKRHLVVRRHPTCRLNSTGAIHMLTRNIHQQYFLKLYVINIIYFNALEYPWNLQWKQYKMTKKLFGESFVLKSIKVITLFKKNKNTKMFLSSKYWIILFWYQINNFTV